MKGQWTKGLHDAFIVCFEPCARQGKNVVIGQKGGDKMTNEQKTKIISLRKQGNSLAEIASKLGLPIGTVKSFCSRNHPVAETALDVESLPSQTSAEGAKCKKCGAPLEQRPHHRQKLFCSDKCRLSWWHDNRHLAKGATEKTCPVCGSSFTAGAERKYCSHSCYIKAKYAPSPVTRTKAEHLGKGVKPRCS